VHELLVASSDTRDAALERCRRYLRGRIRRWRAAQLFLPAEPRDDLVAILAWHRVVREIAGGAAGFERRRGLDELASELENAAGGRARSPAGIALSFAIRRSELPLDELRRPLSEWKREEHVATFETREELAAHARAVAVPEARLLLRTLGASDPHRDGLADALAVGMQLAAWLTSVQEDLRHGRLHVPIRELARQGLSIVSLTSAGASGALARAIASEVGWVRGYFARGWPLCRELGPWRGRRLAFVLRWHAASLSALEAARYDVLNGAPPSGWLRLVACAGTSLASTAPPRLV